jgi:hypothetical protein
VTAPPREARPSAAPVAVPVEDAFAALLEAEQQGVSLADVPVASVPAAPAAPVVTDALIDAVVERVLQRLGGKSLEDVVTRVVLETAERLVRDEIERLKAATRG